LRLVGNPSLTATRGAGFTLEGNELTIASDSNRNINRARSDGEAILESDDLRMQSDTIDLRLTDGDVSRAFVWGDSAHAEMERYELSADSLDIELADRDPRRIRATTSALAEITPDSATVVSDDRNFIKGDTLDVEFERIARPRRAAVDSVLGVTAQNRADTMVVVPKSIESRGHASTFYQSPGKEADKTCPSIHYAQGILIRLSLRGEAIESLIVKGERGAPSSGATSSCGTGRVGGRGGRGGRGGSGGPGGRGGGSASLSRVPPP
jgi:uncharacterized membrane protein YgcG